MKKFNRQITVIVEADTIAQNLLNQMNESFAHRESLVEAIIGSSNDRQLGFIYNSLNGFTNDVTFTVDQKVICSQEVWMYVEKDGEFTEKRLPVGDAVILSIDPYKDETLEIQYTHVGKTGDVSSKNMRVHHSKCKEVPLKNEIIVSTQDLGPKVVGKIELK